uniref:Uncharacterized protein n=1 Tax=Xenopus tropicalis TaxID=8364 RepID=A0A1B8Y0B2_XENTR
MGNKITKPLASSQLGLENEELATVYDMHVIAKLFLQMQDKLNELISVNNEDATNNKLGREMACIAYGDFILSKILDMLRDIELQRIFDFIPDTRIRGWYGKLETGVTMCTIRDLAKVTLHAIKCDDTLSTMIPLTISLPVIPTNGIYRDLAKIHSLGILEESVLKEFKRPPTLLVKHPSGDWQSPDTSCCLKEKDIYICRCNILDLAGDTCGLTLNQTFRTEEKMKVEETITTCAVKLTRWHQDMIKTAYVGDGKYCIIAKGHNIFYGGNECTLSSPNFCLTVKEKMEINGHTIIPVPVYHDTSEVQVKLRYQEEIKNLVPQLHVPIPTLSLDVHKLMERTPEHLLQMKQSTKNAMDSVLQLTTTKWWDSMDNVSEHPIFRLSFKMLICIQGILVICGLLLFCKMTRTIKNLERFTYGQVQERGIISHKLHSPSRWGL